MLRYFVARIGMAILTVWAVCTVTFFIAAFAPGDPAELIAGEHATPQELAAEHHMLGLDRPIWVRYVLYMSALSHGDLGRSYMPDREPVAHFIGRGLPNTAVLAISAISIALIVGTLTGLAAGIYSNTFVDRLLITSSLVGVTIPNFVLGPLLIIIFVLRLKWIDLGGWGYASLGIEPLVLPTIVLAARPASLITRLTRSSIIETLREGYIRTAYAKGLSPQAVLFKHALRNAFLPVMTSAGISFGYLLSGSFVVETIFNVPGIGFESINALTTRNYAVIEGTALILATIFVSVNLILDLLHAALDPRIRTNFGQRT